MCVAKQHRVSSATFVITKPWVPAQVVVNGVKKQVEMWLVSKADTGEVAPGISIAAGERVLVEISRKFTVEQLQGLAYNAGLYMQARPHEA